MKLLRLKHSKLFRAKYHYWFLIALVIFGRVVLDFTRYFYHQSTVKGATKYHSINRENFADQEVVSRTLSEQNDLTYNKTQKNSANAFAPDVQIKTKIFQLELNVGNVKNILDPNYIHQYTLNNSLQLCSNLENEKPSFVIQDSQTWHHVPRRKVMVFSAFYENRETASGPAIRIIGAGFQKAYNAIGDLYCQLWYKEMKTPISVAAEYRAIYRSKMHHDEWCSHFLICKLKDTVSIPYAVSVSPDICAKSNHSLKVLKRNPTVTYSSKISARNATFAICLPSLHNKYRNWQFIIEMFELYKILGASEITIYKSSVDKRTNKVLNYYTQDSTFKVNVINWKITNEGYLKSFYFLQHAQLNDCLYRMSSQHQFVAVHDMDEILIPRTALKWSKFFFDHEVYKPNIGVYMFQHYYFRSNRTSSNNPYFVTEQSLWRTETPQPPGNIRCKSIYNANNIVSIDVHYQFELLGDAKAYMVPPEKGALHHYRKSPMESFRKQPEKYHFVEDQYMHIMYSDLLHKSYRKILSVICDREKDFCVDLKV